VIYRPSIFSDIGARSTRTPAAAFDGNNASTALVSSVGVARPRAGGGGTQTLMASGSCIWSGFPSFVSTTNLTLSVVSAGINPGVGGTVGITANVGGVATTLLAEPVSTNQPGATYTVAVPAGTNLDSCTVQVDVESSSSPSNMCSIAIAEISIS
jgi:hypothetical protein